ncbi:MAG: CoA transferase [Deltaproteobacteria bacterium]|nr:CoA transferase [Deltaproteobacteria bacterium]MBW2421563.1 CoA transferase [Deltaproteobacteria bacterium]
MTAMDDETSADATSGPCAGLRVLDFTTMISGPICTQILGDLGADIIKVEPPGGDLSRLSGAPFREPGFSGFFAQFNRNKRSIVLDLKQSEGREVAQRLGRAVDVVVENLRPGVADRLGIGYEALGSGNPGLIYVSINGFGSDGPYADLPAYDQVIQGLTGLMPEQGGAGTPALVQGGIADKSSGLTAANAVLAALLARARRPDGRGQRVEVAMLDAFASFALPESMMRRCFPPLESDGPASADFFRTWQTADGFVVGLIVQDHQFQALCRVLGRDDLAGDERFAPTLQRFANFQQLVPLLEAEIRRQPTAEFIERAREFGAPFTRVNDVDDFLADPQVEHRGTIVDEHDSRFDAPTRYLAPPMRFSESPASLRRHPPRLGEHTAEVLAEAGLTQAEISQLIERGAAR